MSIPDVSYSKGSSAESDGHLGDVVICEIKKPCLVRHVRLFLYLLYKQVLTASTVRCFYFLYSKISPGWHANALQIASKVPRRMAFALPFFKIEMLAMVMPTLSASSVTLIFRLASMTSMLMMIAIAYTVKSFSDLISMALCKVLSNTAAAVATTIEIKVVTTLTAIKPAGSSS
jgi:hypothetical protein